MQIPQANFRPVLRRAGLLSLTLSILLLAALTVPLRAQTVTNVISFNGTDGRDPGVSALVQGRDGRLYGVTHNGGAYDLGVIFAASATGNGEVLYNFDGPTGNYPNGLTLATDGNFYGTAYLGGASGFGLVFRITPGGSYSVIYNFLGSGDGCYPTAPPIEASDGNLYGTTLGMCKLIPFGTVYKLTRDGQFSLIHQFATLKEGAGPRAALLQAADGNLYGTTSGGGAYQCGTVFKLTTAGVVKGSRSLGCARNAYPEAALIQAADGNFYGTSPYGGLYGLGTVFKVDQTARISTVYNFGSGTDLNGPSGGVLQATDGNLYGAGSGGGSAQDGGLFQIASGSYSVVAFSSFPGFRAPDSALVQHTTGKMYGTSFLGGTYEKGSLYSLDMGLGPFITFVRPTGKVAQTAQILGQGLTGTTSVTFNGVPAISFSVASDTYMTAVVPAGATTGPVVVTMPSGALTSTVNFRISN